MNIHSQGVTCGHMAKHTYTHSVRTANYMCLLMNLEHSPLQLAYGLIP